MFYTANPCADAERHFDALFDAGEAHDALTVQHAKRISAEFVAALPLGEDAKFEDGTVGGAIYEIACSSYAQLLTNIVIAAADSEDPALRKLIKQLGDGYADVILMQKEGVAA